MPPHCDALDGPVVNAARSALAAGNVDLVLPFVHEADEVEIRRAFDVAVAARSQSRDSQDVADRWFFETAVRLHRRGEGAPYEGLKPAGLDVGPVIPLAEQAGVQGRSDDLAALLAGEVKTQMEMRVRHIGELARARDGSVKRERDYVEALLGLQVYSHHLYQQIRDGRGH